MPGAKIVIEDFGGRKPRRAARLLPPNFSQVAENCKLLYGDLRGYQDFRLVHEFPTSTLPRRVWHLKNTAQTEEAWYGSTDPKATLLKSPIVNDAFDRYYLFQEDQPPQVLSFNDIVLGNPSSDLAFGQPVNAPILTPAGGVSTNLVTRVYGYTYVTSWGEESRLSPVASVNVKTDATSVTIGVPIGTPPLIEGRTYQYVRIYRTVTSEAGGQLYFLANVAYNPAGVSYIDTVSDLVVVLNSPLVSSRNDPVPEGVWGARTMGNGSIVAFKGRDLYFSVPYLPHAWPEDWRLTVTDVIVGIEVMGQNIMVLTVGFPVLLYGSYPDAMAMLRFDFPEPCNGYGTIVAAPEGIYFGSFNGLCLFTPTRVQNLTSEMIARNEWRNVYCHDDETRAERLGTQYIASTSNTDGYVIDGLEERIALTDLTGWLTVGDISTDVFTSDILAISFDAVYVWDDPDALEVDYRWKSKEYVLPKPTSLGAMMLHIEPHVGEEWVPTPILNPGYEYPAGMDKLTQMLVKVWRDGVLVFDRPVSDREQCRLDSETVGTTWEVEVQGQCRVQRIALADTGRTLEEL